jgi:glyoxylase-like metal-dependent hydrolase (beta-lactamase superfamily II)
MQVDGYDIDIVVQGYPGKMPGIVAQVAPRHTPGHLIYLLKGPAHDVIFTGDAAKNRAELVCGATDMTYDPAVSAATVATIRSLWRAWAGNVVVPGHDIPMLLTDGRPRYLATRKAAIKAWFGDDLDCMTTIELAVK